MYKHSKVKKVGEKVGKRVGKGKEGEGKGEEWGEEGGEGKKRGKKTEVQVIKGVRTKKEKKKALFFKTQVSETAYRAKSTIVRIRGK